MKNLNAIKRYGNFFSIEKLRKPLMLASSLSLMCFTAFAVGEVTPPAFDLSATMTTAVTSIINNLLGMIGAVLPITVTLLAASIGVSYGIKFIRKIIGKAG